MAAGVLGTPGGKVFRACQQDREWGLSTTCIFVGKTGFPAVDAQNAFAMMVSLHHIFVKQY